MTNAASSRLSGSAGAARWLKVANSRSATFRSRLAGASFQCRLDGGAWKGCGQRAVYRSLAAGSHAFWVRVEAPGGALGRPARFNWIRTAPKDFDWDK